jgi:hypothetical protein
MTRRPLGSGPAAPVPSPAVDSTPGRLLPVERADVAELVAVGESSTPREAAPGRRRLGAGPELLLTDHEV